MIRKAIKLLAAFVLVLMVSAIAVYMIYNESAPKGRQGPEANALAHKMLRAVNQEAFNTTRFIEWTFRNGDHSYKWDKTMGKADVSWNDIKVELDLVNPDKSRVYENEVEVSNKTSRKKAIDKSVKLFNNDSFWLVAPFKVFDQGTRRSIVKLEDGSESLLVTYSSGGSTPGDSYLWKLQPNGFPESFKMWVDIIPVGGLEASWDDWQLTESGAFLPKSHVLGPMKLDMGNVRAYN
ncbi:hypothetical protein [Maribacter sp. HTCC2170]|uniref:hypothetical protein n=1 Tax=Maribacter sp. (strain HTCC2170 / KCCM 42371) TaxID=313603 RepID=UPI00006AFCAC|nr:hypothetical protein [Maribacter sp. HTCC2170]EAR01456.1 hypothetical protein FB2170_12066 [Maribacter sp. HTCC2170]